MSGLASTIYSAVTTYFMAVCAVAIAVYFINLVPPRNKTEKEKVHNLKERRKKVK
jgi:hypothetical protein